MYTLYTVYTHYILYIYTAYCIYIYCILYIYIYSGQWQIISRTPYGVNCTASIQWDFTMGMLYIVQSTLYIYTIHGTVYTVQCTLYCVDISPWNIGNVVRRDGAAAGTISTHVPGVSRCITRAGKLVGGAWMEVWRAKCGRSWGGCSDTLETYLW